MTPVTGPPPPPFVSHLAAREARREARRGKQPGALAVPHLVGVAVWEDDNFSRRQRKVVVPLRASARLSLRHEMEEHEMLAFRRQRRCELLLRRRCKAPGGGELSAE